MSLVTPIHQTKRRQPQAGRIRLGEMVKGRGGKPQPTTLDHFRFTSQERRFLEPLAALYGGEIVEWNDTKSPDRFKLDSPVRIIKVILPPDPLDEWFELWTGERGLQRRCDGEWCDMKVSSEDGADLERVPCVCERKGVRECKYKLRLRVMLPEVASLGTWRLDSGSDNARKEIPGVVDVIEALGGRGFVHATLRLEQRRQPRRRYWVPVLDIEATLDALIAGGQRLAALPDAQDETPLALGSGTVDDDVVDAEIVEDPITGEHPVDPMLGRAWLDMIDKEPSTVHGRVLVRAREIADELGEPLPMNWEGVRTTSTTLIDRLVAENAHLLKETR